jgi:hypothetical protein
MESKTLDNLQTLDVLNINDESCGKSWRLLTIPSNGKNAAATCLDRENWTARSAAPAFGLLPDRQVQLALAFRTLEDLNFCVYRCATRPLPPHVLAARALGKFGRPRLQQTLKV